MLRQKEIKMKPNVKHIILPVDELIWTGGRTKSCTNLVQCFFVYKWYWILVIEVVVSGIIFCFLLFYMMVILWHSACLFSFQLEDYVPELQILSYWLQGRVNVWAFTPAPLAFPCLSKFYNTGMSLTKGHQPPKLIITREYSNFHLIFEYLVLALAPLIIRNVELAVLFYKGAKSSSPKEQLRLSLNNME